MAKAPNYIKQEYNRIRKNLLSQIRKLEKEGFSDAREKLPSIPKKVTQGSINRLRKLSSNKYRGLKSGLRNSMGQTPRDVEYQRRQQGIKKRKEKYRPKIVDTLPIEWDYDSGDTMSDSEYADLVIENYLKELDVNDTFASYLSDFIEGLRGLYNDSAVANMIQRFADTGTLPSRWQMYTAEGAYNFTSSIFAHMYPDMDTMMADSASIEATDALAKSTYHNYTGMFDTMRSDYNNARRSARLAENKNG